MNIEAILRSVLALPTEERSAFLDEACAGDPELRAEVEKALALQVSDSNATFVASGVSEEDPAEDRGTGGPNRISQEAASDAVADSGLAKTFQAVPDSGGDSGTRVIEGHGHDTAPNASNVSDGSNEGRTEFARDESGESPGNRTDTVSTRTPSDRVSSHDPQNSEEATGETIAGRYRLVRKIGEGGMGEVWIAQQSEPVKRRVALKLIKSGMDTRAVLARFEQERQALALMDHPNIAKVFDAGKTPGGQPFFVMELVEGEPLTKFCDEELLTLESRLELFVPICQAVQHAHQKGIVHRDLKPANVLVTEVDGRPVPKVIDFGVAKATAGKITDQTMDTQFGAVIGTLEYMSPEQAGGAVDDIDTRADIYSLGVILYELLTGLRPIDRTQLQKAALTEMIRIIREVEPSKPSTRLSTSEALPSLAAVRRIEPRKLTAALRGELDWVVMKCLEKSRERRYETASGLARDIQRFLADEPVEARPASKAYRLRKLLARNKVTAIAAGLIFLSLVAGVTGTTIGMMRANEAQKKEADQRRIAEAGEIRANDLAARETQARQSAEKRLVQVEKGVEILGSIFENIDPDERKKGEKPLQAILGEKLDQAAASLEGDAVGDPLIVADLKLKLGKSQLGLGNTAKAIAMITDVGKTYEASLSPDDFRNKRAKFALATAFLEDGKADQAAGLLEPLLESEKRSSDAPVAGIDEITANLAAAFTNQGRYDKAANLLEGLLKKARELKAEPGLSNILHNLAMTYQLGGNTKKAIPLMEEAVAIRTKTLGTKATPTLTSMQALGEAYDAVGDTEKSLDLLEKTYRSLLETQGPQHPDTLRTLNGLAATYAENGKHEQAAPLLEQAVKAMKLKLGPDHPNTLTTMSNLAQTYRMLNREQDALPIAEEAYQRKKLAVGPDHPETLGLMNNLAAIYLSMKKRDQALPLLEKSLKAMQARLGPDHPETFPVENNLGALYFQSGKFREAVTLFEGLLAKTRRKLGDDHPNTIFTAFNLAVNQMEAGENEKSLATIGQWMKIALKSMPPGHPTTTFGRNAEARIFEASGKAAEAEAYRRARVDEARRRNGAESAPYADALAALTRNLLIQKEFGEAETTAREVLKIRAATAPESPATIAAGGALGLILAGEKKLAEAEPLLKAAQEKLVPDESAPNAMPKARYLEFLEALAAIYEETGRAEDATRTRGQAEALKAALPRP